MGDEYSFTEQLLVLRGLTETTKALHHAQVIQLKLWGSLVFPNAKSSDWECEVDFDNFAVIYRLTSEVAHPPELPRLVASLDDAVHFLLGDKWRLLIKENDELIYEGLAATVREEDAQ